jgi:hypothetical protein
VLATEAISGKSSLTNLPVLAVICPKNTLQYQNAVSKFCSFCILGWHHRMCAIKMMPHEKLHENSVFDSGRSDLHNNFCGGQAELPEDRQELPHERRQEVQLREELHMQVRGVSRSYIT